MEKLILFPIPAFGEILRQWYAKVGDKVFIELYWLDPATGFVGETMRVSRFCISEEEAREGGGDEGGGSGTNPGGGSNY